MTDWTRRRITEVLFSLARDGELAFWQRKKDTGWHADAVEVDDVLLQRLRDNAIFESERSLSFGLTDRGAEGYEAFFKPDWNRYHELGFRDGQFLLICASQQRRYEMLGAIVDYMNWDRDYGLQYVRTGVRKNWQATYWKQLEFGYFARARFKDPWNLMGDSRHNPYLGRLFCSGWETVEIP